MCTTFPVSPAFHRLTSPMQCSFWRPTTPVTYPAGRSTSVPALRPTTPDAKRLEPETGHDTYSAGFVPPSSVSTRRQTSLAFRCAPTWSAQTGKDVAGLGAVNVFVDLGDAAVVNSDEDRGGHSH